MPKRTMPAGRGDDGWRVSGRDMTHAIHGVRPAGGVSPSKSAILPNLSNPRWFSPSHNLLREFQIQKKPHCCSTSFKMAVREGFEPSIRCRIHTFQACSFSYSDTSPNFGLLFNVLSQHDVRCAVALERGVMYGIRRHAVNAIFHFLRSFAHYPNQVTKNMPFRIPFHQFPVASCKCSPLSASSSEP